MKKALSLLLVLSMAQQYVPYGVFAVEGESCTHHPEHTVECGYVENVQNCSYLENGCSQCQEEALTPAEDIAAECSDLPESELTESAATEQSILLDTETAAANTTQSASKTLYVTWENNLITSWSASTGMTQVYQFFYTSTEEQEILDDSATITVTNTDGSAATGVSITKVDLGWSCYEFTYKTAGEYLVKGYLNGEHIGTLNLTVTGSGIPDGFYFGTNINNQIQCSSDISMQVGDTSNWYIYFNGTKIPGDAVLTYDAAALTVTPLYNADVWEIQAHMVGDYTIGYTGADGQSHTLVVHVKEPMVIPGGLQYGVDENGTINYYNGIGVGAGGSRNVYIYFDGVKIPADFPLVYDREALEVTPLYNADVWQIKGLKVGEYTIQYTDNTGRNHILNVFVNGQGGMPDNLSLKVVNGDQVNYYNGIDVPVDVTVTFEIYFRKQKVTDPNIQWILSGVTMQYNEQMEAWDITPTVQGENTIRHPNGDDDECIRIYGVNSSIDLSEAPSEPGLYFVIFDNHPIFTSVIGLSVPGQCNGPIVLVNKHGQAELLTPETHWDYLQFPAGLNVGYDNMFKRWRLEPTYADGHVITYSKGNETYELTVNASVREQLYAKVKTGPDTWSEWQSVLHVTEDEPTVVRFAWRNSGGTYIETLGTVSGSNDMITIKRDMNTKESTVLVEEWGVNAFATYAYDDYHIYMMDVISHEAKRLALQKRGSTVLVYDYIGTVGQEVEVALHFGAPSQGLSNYSGTLSVSQGLQLTTVDTATGKYKLKILTEGEHTISCTVDGKVYTVTVTGAPESSEGSFFALLGNSSAPTFTTTLTAGQVNTLRFCYGSYGDYEVLDANQLNVAGNTVVLEQNGDAVDVGFAANGQSLIQFTDGDGIVHNHVVRCFSGLPDMGEAYYSDQSINATVNLPYNGQTVTVGPAYCTTEKMVMWPGNSFNHTEEEDFDIQDQLVVGAMYAGQGNSVTEPADKKFYDNISNFHMSFLSFTNTKDPSAGVNVTLETPTTRIWEGRTLQMQKFQGKKGEYFESILLLNFDVNLDGKTHRFYRTADLSYRALPSNKVTVDIADADVLNTLLSNSYCLINYLEDNVDGFVYQGGNLTLKLPNVTYDKLIVSQMILPGSKDVLGVFTIEGSGETTMPGLYSKGFLHCVNNINFVANPAVKMNFAGESFTCGLLVDNTRTDFQPDFDFNTLWQYHPDFQGLSQTDAEELFASYFPSVPTTGNSYNIGSITNCTFTGFDYGMRTDFGGFVQGSNNCIIRNCKYGVYINARGAATLHTDGRGNTIWRNNTFIGNWMPVRIVELPDDLSAYYVRFIDNAFLYNYGDFWITTGGRYFCHRNYYSGKWDDSHKGHWDLNDEDCWQNPRSVDSGDTARAASIVPSDTMVVTNPCRSTQNAIDNLLIFDTDEQQHTAIFQSEADSMLVSADSIGKLTTEVEIPILDAEGETIGSWRIEGGDK